MNSNDIQSRKILHGIRIAILVRAPAIRTLNDIKQFYVKKYLIWDHGKVMAEEFYLQTIFHSGTTHFTDGILWIIQPQPMWFPLNSHVVVMNKQNKVLK